MKLVQDIESGFFKPKIIITLIVFLNINIKLEK